MNTTLPYVRTVGINNEPINQADPSRRIPVSLQMVDHLLQTEFEEALRRRLIEIGAIKPVASTFTPNEIKY